MEIQAIIKWNHKNKEVEVITSVTLINDLQPNVGIYLALRKRCSKDRRRSKFKVSEVRVLVYPIQIYSILF